MKILIIPDVHGQPDWKEYIKEEVDYTIFLGDYFDNWSAAYKGKPAEENFQDICSYVKEDTEHRKMILGNHDFENYIMYGGCSGFQSDWYNEYNKALIKNISLINICFELEGIVFSHAGISKSWIKRIFDKTEVSVKEINEKFQTMLFNFVNYGNPSEIKKVFSYYDKDYSGYGEHIGQTPLWIRPMQLMQNPYFTKQVVGHTELNENDFCIQKNDNAIVLFADSKKHTPFVIDTEKVFN